MTPRKIYNDFHPQNRIGIREIRQDASTILARVEEGEEFIITNRGVPVGRLIPIDKDDDQLILEMIDSGDILEADGNLWQIPLPTYKVKGKSASEQLIEERESYR
jgi:prevent-host-death family protein